MNKKIVIVAASATAVIMISSGSLIFAKNTTNENTKFLCIKAVTNAAVALDDKPKSCKAKNLSKSKCNDSGNVCLMLSEITGLTEDEIKAKIENGQTPWQIAKDAEKLEEYKTATKENMKIRLSALVNKGALTQEKADEMINDFDKNLHSD